MIKKTIVFLLCLTVGLTTANAQLFKNQKKRAEERAKQRAEQKAQNKVDRTVDEAVDEAFGKIGSLFKKKKPAESESTPETDTDDSTYDDEDEQMAEDISDNIMSMLGGGKSPSELGLPDKYVFDTYVKSTMTTINKRGKKDSQPMNYLLPSNSDYVAYQMEEEGEQGMGVIDIKRKKMVGLVTTEGMSMATVMDMEAIMESAADYQDEEEMANDMEDFKITKTGKTKTIAGYECEQFLISGDDVEGEIWKALNFDGVDFMSMGAEMGKMMQQQNKSMKLPDGYAELMGSGFLFEGTFEDKKRKETTMIQVQSVEKKRSEIDLTKYRMMDFNGFMKK
ncbi:MAG: DUF4412 domain-containing protein [Bacteroidota bacterium]